jgi:hypothetical protein
MGGSAAAAPPAPAWMAAGARRWLEEAGVAFDGSDRRAFNALPLAGARVSLAEAGRAVCSLRVTAELTDAEGNWHPGAIAAAADDVCAAAIMSVEGIIKVSVHYDISYFSPAKLHVRKPTYSPHCHFFPSNFLSQDANRGEKKIIEQNRTANSLG